MHFSYFQSVLLLFSLALNLQASTSLTLENAISQALLNSKLKKISEHDLRIAKARYAQAQSASYPIVDATVVFNRADDIFLDNTKATIDAPIVGAIDIAYDHTILGENTTFGQIDVTYPPDFVAGSPNFRLNDLK